MKMNIVIALIVAGMLVWGLFSILNVSEGWEAGQGLFLIAFALAIAGVLYFGNRNREGR